MLTRFSRLRPVTLDLLHTVTSHPPADILQPSWTCRMKQKDKNGRQGDKETIGARTRARANVHTKWADTAHRQRQKHHQACERVVKLNTESNIVVRELVEGDCVS